MSLDTISLCLLALSGGLAAAFVWRGQGWSLSIVFFYLLSYQIMEMALIWLGRFTDLPYISMALAINSIFFYIFLNAGCRLMALVLGFDAIFAGANLWLLQNGIQTLDSIYGHEGVIVTMLLLLIGTHSGISHQHTTFGDSWNFSIKNRLRPLHNAKRANR